MNPKPLRPCLRETPPGFVDAIGLDDESIPIKPYVVRLKPQEAGAGVVSIRTHTATLSNVRAAQVKAAVAANGAAAHQKRQKAPSPRKRAAPRVMEMGK